jgi:hypothetical protein
VRQFPEGDGVCVTREIKQWEAILALPLSSMISVRNIEKENGIAW